MMMNTEVLNAAVSFLRSLGINVGTDAASKNAGLTRRRPSTRLLVLDHSTRWPATFTKVWLADTHPKHPAGVLPRGFLFSENLGGMVLHFPKMKV